MNQGSIDRRGYVYILVNPVFTGFVKIGKTINEPEARARQLSSGSGVPAPYAVAWDAFVSDCDHVEKLIHQQLADTRSRNDREFFAIPLKHAIAIASSIVVSFSCEPEAASVSSEAEAFMRNVAGTSIATPLTSESREAQKRVPRRYQEELIEVAEDCPVDRASEPLDRNPKSIARIGYEILIETPYSFTEREFFIELHVERRKRSDLKIESYNIKRAQVVKAYGWGIHRNEHGKLALVAMESARYRELQESIRTTKSYRTNKNTTGSTSKS